MIQVTTDRPGRVLVPCAKEGRRLEQLRVSVRESVPPSPGSAPLRAQDADDGDENDGARGELAPVELCALGRAAPLPDADGPRRLIPLLSGKDS